MPESFVRNTLDGELIHGLLVGGYLMFVFVCIVYSCYLKKKHNKEIEQRCGIS